MKLTLPAVAVPPTEIATPEGALILPGTVLPERMIEIDPGEIRALISAARAAAGRCYAPYSKFPVGAALVMDDDPRATVFTGANVENSSFGGTVCAERTALFAAVAQGFRRLRLLAVSAERTRHDVLATRAPCGICRQAVREFAGPESLVVIDSGRDHTLGEIFDIDRLLPFGFHLS
ncbi:hypothetical protein BH23VER1_BH23VER1_03790 [soil metagenome]